MILNNLIFLLTFEVLDGVGDVGRVISQTLRFQKRNEHVSGQCGALAGAALQFTVKHLADLREGAVLGLIVNQPIHGTRDDVLVDGDKVLGLLEGARHESSEECGPRRVRITKGTVRLVVMLKQQLSLIT